MTGQIFISYKAEEKETAKQIKNKIENSGYSCWMAPDSIPVGSNYASEVENAIKNCKALVLIFSEVAMNSPWVEKEVIRALGNDKPVLPFRTELFDLNSQYNYLFANVQFYDAFEDYDSAFTELVSRINGICGPSDKPRHNLIINYVDGKGNSLAEQFTALVAEDDEFSVPSPSVPNRHVAGNTTGKVTGKMGSSDIILDVVYALDTYNLTINYVDSEGNPVAEQYTSKVGYGESYSVPSPAVINRRVTDEEKAIVTGRMGTEDVTVDVIYELTGEISNKKSKKSKLLKIILIILAIIIALVGAIVAVVLAKDRPIKIAGEKIRITSSTLEISDCELTGKDISNINKLKEITKISLVNCGLNDEEIQRIKVFQEGNKNELYSLSEVNLSGNKEITDLSFLKKCENVNYLNVSGTGIKDFSGIGSNFASESTNSDYYDDENDSLVFDAPIPIIADGCKLTSLKGLETLKPKDGARFELSFIGCSLNDTVAKELGEIVKSNGAVEVLRIDDNPDVSSLSSLSGVSSIKSLSVSGTGIKDFTGLEKCIYLWYLSACNCKLDSLKGLENTTLLKEVYLSNNKLEQVDILKSSSGTMDKLFVDHNKLTTLDVIRDMTSLRVLDAGYNQISDMFTFDNFFNNCKNSIVWLSVRNNKFEKIPYGWRNLEKLKYFDISNNELSSLGFYCFTCPGVTIDASNNKFSPSDMNSLAVGSGTVDIHGNTGSGALELTNNCSCLIVDYDEKVDYSALAKNVDSIKIIGCPLSKQVEMSNIFGSKIEYVTAEQNDDLIYEKMMEVLKNIPDSE